MCSGRLRAEEDGRSEDPFEGCYQSPIFFPALRHAENVEHLRGRPETNDLTLLTNCQRCQENRNEAILAKWQAEVRVTGDLECEKTVTPFIDECGTGRAPHGQAAEDKRSGGKPELLVRCVTPVSDQLDALGLAQSPPRDVELRKTVLQK